ncbi:hypothetical protein [Caviibacterium pharyngocola]|uniref:Uncharacterized protein n=1 Tax=Caviibacterium pharyngocola TaxID=28159 RepID=A0A2M8RV86_9PAST|nr:hypothetical protein [Caviibacterium pharyngocola]PJG82791.1 hypothetical protein CVP04_07460 [Caviibacterium pharyngocola]
MSHSTQNVDLFDPFADVSPTQPTQKSVSFRFGEKLGRIFLKLKGKINRKYRAVTEGIHHQVEAEAEMERLAQEQWLQEQVDEVAAQYHLQLKRSRLRYALVSVSAFIAGGLSSVLVMVYF